jgi:hypothetical protein
LFESSPHIFSFGVCLCVAAEQRPELWWDPVRKRLLEMDPAGGAKDTEDAWDQGAAAAGSSNSESDSSDSEDSVCSESSLKAIGEELWQLKRRRRLAKEKALKEKKLRKKLKRRQRKQARLRKRELAREVKAAAGEEEDSGRNTDFATTPAGGAGMGAAVDVGVAAATALLGETVDGLEGDRVRAAEREERRLARAQMLALEVDTASAAVALLGSVACNDELELELGLEIDEICQLQGATKRTVRIFAIRNIATFVSRI